MWIRTESGNLCNLGLATDVMIITPRAEGEKYVVRALFGRFSDGEGGIETDESTLGKFAERLAAEVYLTSLFAQLRPDQITRLHSPDTTLAQCPSCGMEIRT